MLRGDFRARLVVGAGSVRSGAAKSPGLLCTTQWTAILLRKRSDRDARRFQTFLSTAKLTHTPTSDGSDDCFIAGGHFAFTRSHASILLNVLPPIVHIQKESDRAALRWCIERMMQEIHEPQPGGSLIAEHVAYMMLIQALRLHLAEGLKGGVGWL